MVKSTYVLKTSPLNPKKIDRLVKNIEVNSRNDRKEAEEILRQCKERLADDEVGIDSFSKIVQSAITALNQMGRANELLLKIVQTAQKFNSSSSSSKTSSSNESFFANLENLTKNITDASEED